jgi:hypothetical protein
MRAARVLGAAMLMLSAACTSPEATRARAGGPGADVGNHGEIELHAGADPYYGTPKALAAPRDTPVAASTRTR